MGTQLTQFAPDPLPVMYGTAGQLATDVSNIPRGELDFYIANGSVTAGNATDNQRVEITCTLPRGFAFLLTDLDLYMQVPYASDWNVYARANMSNTPNSGMLKSTSAIRLDAGARITKSDDMTYDELVYHPVDLPDRLFYPPANDTSNPTLVLYLVNATANQGAAFCTFNARFLQYDVLQAHRSPVNTPTYTRS